MWETSLDRVDIRIKEAFIGWLADQSAIDIIQAYNRYVSTADRHGDNFYMDFPQFVDTVATLPYVQYEETTGCIHFTLGLTKMNEREMFEKSFERPCDYFKLSAEHQWSIDRRLGILDWDGDDLSDEDRKRFKEHYN